MYPRVELTVTIQERVSGTLERLVWPFRTVASPSELVEDVEMLRGMLQRGSERFFASPVSLSLAWFPSNASPDVGARLMSDYGVATDYPELEKQFYEEVAALVDVIEGDEAATSSSEADDRTRAVSRMNRGLAKRAHAMSHWDRIGLPIRRWGEHIAFIRSPRDLMGSPTISTLPIEAFVPLVAVKTASDHFRILQLEARESFWKWTSLVLALMLLWALG